MRTRLALAPLAAALLLAPVSPASVAPAVTAPPAARFPASPASSPLPLPALGYHHLGASSADDWSGVLGRVTVRDPDVRRGTNDFVAARFLAKRDTSAGNAWIEAGWAETGWSGDGRQRVYTYDTNTRRWQFYDQYPIGDGDRIWLSLTASDDRSWQAWLWWHDAWRLLTTQALPLTTHAQIEQYLEVYVDPDHPGDYPVPTVTVDNVQLRAGDGLHAWRATVPTLTSVPTDRFCVDWQTSYDTWAAGTCP
ncbi:hypothetical protein [Rhizomonospora bruguierae]|uniref:hypothetical protein n=1 Tax=Rhizomonospora bruguierae TaxID=1581705 RepID=UPI0020BD9CD2|nr:hypothetical protein [Micromonospora sp. NBRC 107566]